MTSWSKCIMIGGLAWGCGTESRADPGGVSTDASPDGGTMAAPPSCAGLGTTCGGGVTDCCSSPSVAGGAFQRSYFGETTGYSERTYAAIVSDFRLDQFEVTVGRFRAFVAAGAPTPAAGAGKHDHLNGGNGLLGADGSFEPGWDPSWTLSSDWNADLTTNCVQMDFATWTPSPGENEERPINCLTWYEAYAFCVWDGGFLPSEAEWNYAAAGGAEERLYAWGDATPTPNHASYSVDATQQCMGDGMPGCTLTDLIPVGTKPLGDGKYGQSDLAGNVMEWTVDWDVGPYPNPCNDCSQLTPATYRMTRGSGLHFDASALRTDYRFSSTPGKRFFSIGVRCARAVTR
jgi:formylglycine-generating enzyme required for sulfatase activity